MSFRIKSHNGTMTAYLDGEIDHHTAESIRRIIDEAIDKEKPSVLRLDFFSVDFMDSSGVGLVMGRYKKVSPYGGKVELSNMGQAVRRIMKMSGIEKIAKIV